MVRRRFFHSLLFQAKKDHFFYHLERFSLKLYFMKKMTHDHLIERKTIKHVVENRVPVEAHKVGLRSVELCLGDSLFPTFSLPS